MQGDYTVQRKVADLPEGYEFQANRFIADKNDRGCHVQYRSQEGDMRYIMVGFKGEFASTKSWMDNNAVVDCIVDFVPDALRVRWTELQKLGKCFLNYNPEEDLWTICYPENPAIPINTDTVYGDNQSKAIDEAIFFISGKIIHNGYRWFDCRNPLDIKKISDDEARKLINE